MGYVEVRGDLVGLFDEEPFRRAQRRMVRRMAEVGHDVIVRNTPVDSGNLRTSWYLRPATGARFTVRGVQRGWEVRVATDVEYAPHVEWGTGLYGPEGREYTIEPRAGAWLRWRDPRTGEWVYRRRVTHPGSRGAHMAKIGADYVERSVEEIAAPILERLRTEVGR